MRMHVGMGMGVDVCMDMGRCIDLNIDMQLGSQNRYVCACVNTHKHVYAQVYAQVYAHACAIVHAYVSAHVHARAYTHAYTHADEHTLGLARSTP